MAWGGSAGIRRRLFLLPFHVWALSLVLQMSCAEDPGKKILMRQWVIADPVAEEDNPEEEEESSVAEENQDAGHEQGDEEEEEGQDEDEEEEDERSDERMFYASDLDWDALLDPHEFMKMVTGPKQQFQNISEEALTSLFSEHDLNRDGKISAWEWLTVTSKEQDTSTGPSKYPKFIPKGAAEHGEAAQVLKRVAANNQWQMLPSRVLALLTKDERTHLQEVFDSIYRGDFDVRVGVIGESSMVRFSMPLLESSGPATTPYGGSLEHFLEEAVWVSKAYPPGYTVVTIGESLTLLSYAQQLLFPELRVLHLPFTGLWAEYEPTEQYEMLLETLGAAPAQLASARHGVVIVDYVYTGEGLGTFTQLMTKIADLQGVGKWWRDNVKVVRISTDPEHKTRIPRFFEDPDERDTSLTLSDDTGLHSFFNHLWKSRCIPKNDPSNWRPNTTEPLELRLNLDLLFRCNLLRFRLADYVDKQQTIFFERQQASRRQPLYALRFQYRLRGETEARDFHPDTQSLLVACLLSHGNCKELRIHLSSDNGTLVPVTVETSTLALKKPSRPDPTLAPSCPFPPASAGNASAAPTPPACAESDSADDSSLDGQYVGTLLVRVAERVQSEAGVFGDRGVTLAEAFRLVGGANGARDVTVLGVEVEEGETYTQLPPLPGQFPWWGWFTLFSEAGVPALALVDVGESAFRRVDFANLLLEPRPPASNQPANAPSTDPAATAPTQNANTGVEQEPTTPDQEAAHHGSTTPGREADSRAASKWRRLRLTLQPSSNEPPAELPRAELEKPGDDSEKLVKVAKVDKDERAAPAIGWKRMRDVMRQRRRAKLLGRPLDDLPDDLPVPQPAPGASNDVNPPPPPQ